MFHCCLYSQFATHCYIRIINIHNISKFSAMDLEVAIGKRNLVHVKCTVHAREFSIRCALASCSTVQNMDISYFLALAKFFISVNFISHICVGFNSNLRLVLIMIYILPLELKTRKECTLRLIYA